MRLRTLLVCGLCIVTASAVHAQNIVADPGFESAAPGLHEAGFGPPFPADLGDGAWTTTAGGVSVTNVSVLAHSGNNALDLSPGDPGAISQTLATVSGQTYDLSFWAETSLDTNTFDVTFGGVSVFSQALPRTGLGTANYRLYTVTNLTAPTAATALTFAANGGFGDVFLDDVSVVGRASAVPEPGTLALLGGIVVAGTIRLRRRRA